MGSCCRMRYDSADRSRCDQVGRGHFDLKIGLISRHSGGLWLRQTAGGDGFAGGAQIVLGEADAVDALVVFDEPAKGQTTTVPRHRRILVTSEPRGIKRYSIAYLNQFGTVISPHRHWVIAGTCCASNPVCRGSMGLPSRQAAFAQRSISGRSSASSRGHGGLPSRRSSPPRRKRRCIAGASPSSSGCNRASATS